jgi:lipid-A-disaccharide synthase-like uncharacterized protein
MGSPQIKEAAPEYRSYPDATPNRSPTLLGAPAANNIAILNRNYPKADRMPTLASIRTNTQVISDNTGLLGRGTCLELHPMEWLRHLTSHWNQLFSSPLGIWKLIGLVGNGFFFSRVLVQWHATEKRKEVVVPLAFWWLSLLGSSCLLAYSIFGTKDLIFIFANAFNWIPAIRNLRIHRKSVRSRLFCPACQQPHPGSARFCMACGTGLLPTPPIV